jgi:hypothetical protein
MMYFIELKSAHKQKRKQQKREEGTMIGTKGNQKTKSLIAWHKTPVRLTKQHRQVGSYKENGNIYRMVEIKD